jgi:hypothetical protein
VTCTFAAGDESIVLALKDISTQTVNVSVNDGVATHTSETACADSEYHHNLTFNGVGLRFVDAIQIASSRTIRQARILH